VKEEKVILSPEWGALEGEYVFSEISWAKRNRILQKYTKYSSATGQVESSDNVSIQAELVWASLRGRKPAKSPLTLAMLLDETDNGVPVEVGELFSQVVSRLCTLTKQDLHFLLEQLSEEDRIQLFQSFGYAKNSAGPPSS
jgi:hypothetical protein